MGFLLNGIHMTIPKYNRRNVTKVHTFILKRKGSVNVPLQYCGGHQDMLYVPQTQDTIACVMEKE